MILTDFYEFLHLPECKSKARMDCKVSTKSYNEFEAMRNKHGKLFIYLCDVPDTFKVDVKRKADKSITTSKGKNLSSVFILDVTLPFAYGDVKGTSDCILIIHHNDYSKLEIFIARGQKNNRVNLWQMLSDGELDDEISVLRDLAVTESVTQNSE